MLTLYFIRCRDCAEVTQIYPGTRWVCCGSCRSIEYTTVEPVPDTDDEYTEATYEEF